MNRKKFDDEYGRGEEVRTGMKPDDFYETFNGNTDDGFKIGLAVGRKQLKLYAEFYSADIIVASPLGLRMVIGSQEEKARINFHFPSSQKNLPLICFSRVDF